ncbi:NAD-dependent epimerase/dehydratase family protein [Methanobrevibacter sp.]|uniref:NAD-dependent epimerase/dehydratase family protein n=1 Tax=Methanobrevibacter sp. TaxID=66852 RepID=UPI0025D6BBC2|nr:NAD-dependent epimerase/dehydratase family protein [Methanobrevibacter sp.]MBQ6511984.1 NAD-dependent epimerase/dehydratase family protein [Methanobrevibacter sp.]
MKNKNILITGGLGFIGSHIADELIDDNKVTIIDNLSTGNMKNLKNPKHANLKITIDDLSTANLDELLEDIDYIFHLSAMASVPLSVEDPVSCNENNVNATIRLLKSAVKNNVKKIVFSSSSAVYGENTNMPLKESEIPMPTSPYAASKACCELYLQSFYDSYGLNYTALRYFNVFGPKQDKNSQYAAVIPNFISALLEGKQPVIYGDGEQTRDFIFVKDVVQANIKACESDYNGIVNVASGEKLSVNRLYRIIQETLNSDVEPEYLPERAGDIKHSLADVSNLEKIDFEVNPSNFEENLKETITWFESVL